ncbi:MAG: hydroxymethylglutaryl-CoA lyase [Thermodesulfobacteriota bacterium]|nr:hydroxymethylglutaryl-CoA lyase [Thermodesulfobacteriota bacterium]
MITFPKKVVIEEQGLRDGLQSENIFVPTEKKLAVIDALLDAGVRRVQVTSFVNPKLIPQLADADQVCASLKKRDGVVYSGLVLNPKGIERAAQAGLTHVAASISASDTHSRKNANASLAEARQRFAEMVKIGKNNGLTVRGGLQCVFGCRFEGKIDPNVVLDIVKEQLDLGIDEIALADSTGMANPRSIQEICEKVQALANERPIILHLHDTEGKGLANVLAALQVGVTYFDTAFGGMGGCPFIKGASGNISTEDVVFMLAQMGIDTGIDVDKIAAISRSLEDFFDKRFSGKMHRVLERDDIRIIR